MDGAVSGEGRRKDSKGVEQAGEELQSASATKSKTSHETMKSPYTNPHLGKLDKRTGQI